MNSIIEFHELFDIPSATPQQRKLHGKASYPSRSLSLARASWQALLERHAPPEPLDGPLRLVVELLYHQKMKDEGVRYKTTRPDGVNVLKLVEDVMTECGYWHDDRQLSVEEITRYVWCGEEMVRIKIFRLEDKDEGNH